MLKPDAVPTENKPLNKQGNNSSEAKKSPGSLSRKKGSTL